MQPRFLGTVPFVDGVTRQVHRGDDGGQFVVDADGQRVYGTWVYVDEPGIVSRK